MKDHDRNGGEWYTPVWLLGRVRMALGGSIPLDVASCEYAQTRVQADRWFGPESMSYEDGLDASWNLPALCNCPFDAESMKKFSGHALRQLEARICPELVMITPAKTSARWWQSLRQAAGRVCQIKGRVSFDGPPGVKSTVGWTGTSVFYCGPWPRGFEAAFGDLGVIER